MTVQQIIDQADLRYDYLRLRKIGHRAVDCLTIARRRVWLRHALTCLVRRWDRIPPGAHAPEGVCP